MPNQLTLGIAKIGDLLLQNRITQVEDGEEITDILLKIPEYQRPYKWTGKNVNQLFDDILFAKNENKEVYRVGTLILHADNANDCYNIRYEHSIIMSAGLSYIYFCCSYIFCSVSNRS